MVRRDLAVDNLSEQADAPSDAAESALAYDYDGWFETSWGCYAFATEMSALALATGAIAGRRVIDVGCGTGRFTTALEDRGDDAVGVDLDTAMLAVATIRVKSLLIVAYAHCLPLSSAAFDLTVTVTLCD